MFSWQVVTRSDGTFEGVNKVTIFIVVGTVKILMLLLLILVNETVF